MKKSKDLIFITAILLGTSCVMYLIDYIIFGDLRNTIYYTFLDISFLPLNVLIVTFVFNNLLERKEKNRILDKLNMLVGLFYTEVGLELMKICIKSDSNADGLIKDFNDLNKVEETIKKHHHKIETLKIDFQALDDLLSENKELIINLIENPNILEQQFFSELLISIMHLRDEMSYRKKHGIEDEDLKHLTGDLNRVYHYITLQWVYYLKHLSSTYPYLYMTAISHNPYTHY